MEHAFYLSLIFVVPNQKFIVVYLIIFGSSVDRSWVQKSKVKADNN